MWYVLLTMNLNDSVTRRSFLATAAAASLAPAALAASRYPIGLELYSCRDILQKDLEGTVTAVAKMGYQLVEFYSPYFAWAPDRAKQVRKLLDDLGIRCRSTHNGAESFAPENAAKAIELNSILGSQFIVMASPPRAQGVDGWKKVADLLNTANEKFKSAGIRAGYHNHQAEFKAFEGATRPIDVIAENTSKDVLLQLDVGTCLEVGQDPVAWIDKNPGRFATIHCKDYSPEAGKGYRVLFGDGPSPWKQIFQAAERSGGVQFYIIEQEGYSLPELETVKLCLDNFKKIHG
jgi:sugar phosphate isomerase/epimerase